MLQIIQTYKCDSGEIIHSIYRLGFFRNYIDIEYILFKQFLKFLYNTLNFNYLIKNFLTFESQTQKLSIMDNYIQYAKIGLIFGVVGYLIGKMAGSSSG